MISFDCEAPEVTETIVNPAGQKAYSINPLNWKTDSTAADKSENIGSRFMKSSGKIIGEYTGLCGCYIDEERGVLKVTDVDSSIWSRQRLRTRRREQRGGSLFGTLINREYT